MKRQKRVFLIFLLCFLSLFYPGAPKTASAAALDNWHVREVNAPLYGGIGYGNGVFVAVGAYGEIMTSPDGAIWTSRTSGTAEDLAAVAFGNGKIVTVGSNGTILMSVNDGATWSEKRSELDVSLYGITYGNGKFVAVGDKQNPDFSYRGIIMTSSDGADWSATNLAVDATLWGIAYGNGKFVAVGENYDAGTDYILTSSDGAAWPPAKDTGSGEALFGVAYGSGSFIAVGHTYNGGGKIISFPDNGATWLPRESGLLGDIYLYGIAYGSGTFAIAGVISNYATGLVLTSPDGGAWTSRTAVAQYGSLWSAAYGNATFAALTMDGTIIQSDPLPLLQSIIINGGAAYTANRTVNLALSAEGGMAAAMQFSHDNVSWSVPEPFSTAKFWTLAEGDGRKDVYVRFQDSQGNWSATLSAAIILDTVPPVVVAQPPGGVYGEVKQVTLSADEPSATIYYTLDNSPPTVDSPVYQGAISIGEDATLKYLARDPAGNSGEVRADVYQIVVVSGDPLNNWQVRVENTSAYNIGWGNGIFVAVGYNGAVMTSPDGAAWTPRDAGTTDLLSGVACGDGIFAVVGDSGTILTSADNGATWTVRDSGAALSLKGIAYGQGRFVAVGEQGAILTSADKGATWSLNDAGAVATLWGIAYGNGIFAAVGDNGIILTSDDGVFWTTQESGTTEYLWGIAYGNGLFAAVGTSGTILTSADDGLTWTPRTSGVRTDLDFYGIAYGNGRFAVVGEDWTSGAGQILTSADGAVWTSRNSPAIQGLLLAVAYSRGAFVALSAAGAVIQSELLKGDINNDWKADLSDVILYLRVMNGERPVEVRPDYFESQTDPTGDGKIGLPDAIFILQKISGRR